MEVIQYRNAVTYEEYTFSRFRECGFKVRFKTQIEATKYLTKRSKRGIYLKEMNAYFCHHCGYWHIGNVENINSFKEISMKKKKKCPCTKRVCDWYGTEVCDRMRGGKEHKHSMCILLPMMGGTYK